MGKSLLPVEALSDDISRVDFRTAAGPDHGGFQCFAEPYEIMNGRRVVRGSNDCSFQEDCRGGPYTRYEALFDPRPEFNGLRFSLERSWR